MLKTTTESPEMTYIEYIPAALHHLCHARMDMFLNLGPVIHFASRSIGAVMRSMSCTRGTAVDERLQGQWQRLWNDNRANRIG